MPNEQKTFVAIFDQHNGLKGEARTIAPTNFFKWAYPLPGARILVSASASNQDTDIKLGDIHASYWFADGYTDEELAAWQKKNSFFLDLDLSEVTKVTSNAPFELDLMCQWKEEGDIDDLVAVIEQYGVLRKHQMTLSHDKFVEALPNDGKRRQYQICLTYICTARPVIDEVLVYDRQLFYLDGLRIKPVLPMALQVAYRSLSAQTQTAIRTYESDACSKQLG